MRKITLFIVFAIMATSMFAGGGWATSAVSITKDGGSAYSFKLNDEGWTDGDWVLNTAFNDYNFGTPTSLILNGGAGNAWTDDSPGHTTESFKLFYRVYKTDASPGEWIQLNLDHEAYRSGNNYIFDKTNAAVDILALATINGTNTYVLEVVMSKNQYYTGGNWNSMIPGGQGTAYSDAVAGYKATFTKTNTTTEIENPSTSNIKISSNNQVIKAEFNGDAEVSLYNALANLMFQSNVRNGFEYATNRGLYLLKINGITQKIIVR